MVGGWWMNGEIDEYSMAVRGAIIGRAASTVSSYMSDRTHGEVLTRFGDMLRRRHTILIRMQEEEIGIYAEIECGSLPQVVAAATGRLSEQAGRDLLPLLLDCLFPFTSSSHEILKLARIILDDCALGLFFGLIREKLQVLLHARSAGSLAIAW